MPKTIHVPAAEVWNEETETFEYPYGRDGTDIVLEHSLMSVQKWESRWHKPFLTKEKHTTAEIIDYIRCMTITQNVKDVVYENIDEAGIKNIVAYIEDTMTAIDFRKLPSKSKPGQKQQDETVTAELIYYWMTIYNIWYDCRKWHLEQLLNLIELCSRKTEEANERAAGKHHNRDFGKRTPPPKMSSESIANRQALNRQRLKAAAGKKP